MDAEIGVSARFTAQHEACSRAAWPHGHAFVVEAWLTGEQGDLGWPVGSDGFESVVQTLCTSLEFQDLGATLPGSSPSPMGLATSLLSQLAARFPRMTEVSVTDENGVTGRARRTPRVL